MKYNESQIRETFYQEMKEIFEHIDNGILMLERTPGDLELIQNLFRKVHTLKGSSGVFGLHEVSDLTHHAEDLLDKMRAGTLSPKEDVFSALLHCFDRLKDMIAASEKGEDLSTFHNDDIIRIFSDISSESPISVDPAVSPMDSSRDDALEPQQSESALENDFVRLKKEKLDQLMNQVGELVTMRNLFVHLSNKLEIALPENDITKNFKEGSRLLTRLSASLQESVMNARMVPVGTVFTKYARLVRDISMKLNKKTNLIIEGDETELDKTISETIGEPIMHLIRNSIDHGIETPEIRKERGKPEVGTLLLKASYEGNNVKLVIRDDGNGIDLERVKNKAIHLGFVTKEHAEKLSKKEIINFIFHSGFSTATEITHVSGRGVGMDVVQNNIRKSHGSIFVDTNTGQGTEFKIILPLSLAVMEALLIGVDGEIYAFPQESIIETMRIKKTDIVNSKQPSIQLRGEIIPIVKLSEVIKLKKSILDDFISQEKKKLHDSHERFDRFENDTNPVVIMQIENIKIGILVDTLYCREQIMIKPLGGFLTNTKLFRGACIMGNGSIVLVLEPNLVLPQIQREHHFFRNTL